MSSLPNTGKESAPASKKPKSASSNIPEVQPIAAASSSNAPSVKSFSEVAQPHQLALMEIEDKELSSVMKNLRSYITSSVFENQATVRNYHRLLKDMDKVLDCLYKPIADACAALEIKLVCDLGDKQAVNQLSSALDKKKIESMPDGESKKAVTTLMDLVGMSMSFPHYDATLFGEESHVVHFTGHWFVKFTQSICFETDWKTYKAIIKISDDHSSFIINALKPIMSSNASSNLLLLIEKMIEATVKRLNKTSKEALLQSCKSYFMESKVAYEKLLPVNIVEEIKPEIKAKMRTNKKYKPKAHDMRKVRKVVKPCFHTTGFLSDEEKKTLKLWNVELNRANIYVPDLPIADGSAIKGSIIKAQRSLFEKVAMVNRSIASRKQKIHKTLTGKYPRVENKETEPFTSDQWKEAQAETKVDPIDWVISQMFPEDFQSEKTLKHLIPSLFLHGSSNKLASSQEEDTGNKDMTT